MNNIPEVINNTLEVLSTKFGTSVDQLWQVMIQQQIYEGYAHLAITILFSLGFIGTLIFFIRYIKNERDEDIIFGAFVINALLLMFVIIFAYVSYMELINPQYQAIREFLEVLKGE